MKENQKDVINLAVLLQFLRIYLPFQFGLDKVEPVSYTDSRWNIGVPPPDDHLSKIGSRLGQRSDCRASSNVNI